MLDLTAPIETLLSVDESQIVVVEVGGHKRGMS